LAARGGAAGAAGDAAEAPHRQTLQTRVDGDMTTKRRKLADNLESRARPCERPSGLVGRVLMFFVLNNTLLLMFWIKIFR
jgi:hypothetical protein